MRIFNRNKGKIEIEQVTIQPVAAIEQAEVLARLEEVENELGVIRNELEEVKQKVEDDC